MITWWQILLIIWFGVTPVLFTLMFMWHQIRDQLVSYGEIQSQLKGIQKQLHQIERAK